MKWKQRAKAKSITNQNPKIDDDDNNNNNNNNNKTNRPPQSK